MFWSIIRQKGTIFKQRHPLANENQAYERMAEDLRKSAYHLVLGGAYIVGLGA